MFDIERKISEWRRQMLAAGITAPEPLNELETHLRADFRALLSAGEPEDQAFQRAVARLGSPDSVRLEFNKIKDTSCAPVRVGALLWIASTLAMAVWFFGFHGTGDFGKQKLLLAAHVLCITSGYEAAFLAGAFGICYVCWQWFGKLTPGRRISLNRGAHSFIKLAAGLVACGFLLGMLWYRGHSGIYWGGDAREIGGLCGLVWLAGLCAARQSGLATERGMMLTCICGNVIISVAWLGAVIISSHPESHGNGMMIYGPLSAWVAIHFCFMVMGFAPRSNAPVLESGGITK